MAVIAGYELLGKMLRMVGVDTVFNLLGGPMAVLGYEKQGIRIIDVRHEQAAAMMAHAYSRVSGKTGVCITGAGPDALNLVTGIANAYMDCSPLVALCGSSGLSTQGMGAFQEVDQLNVMKPIVKHAWQVPTIEKLPELVHMAFNNAIQNKPGPIYLDFPGEVLWANIDESKVAFYEPIKDIYRPMGDPEMVKKAVDLLRAAKHPLILAGSGVLWSQASAQILEFVEATGIPFYTTPLARGLIPEDHRLCFPGARSVAWRETDVLLVVGTRPNFIINHLQPPVFAPDMKLIQVNINAEDIGHNRPVDVGIVGDARTVLTQLVRESESGFDNRKIGPWIERLKVANAEREARIQALMNSDARPIHPLRLCKEIKEFLPRDAILAVDGHETLNYARQSIPCFYPGHRLNPGPSGCMGVAIPFGIGAKVTKPDKLVLTLSGDGSFGMNGMEIDTAVRHKIPLVVVISNNGGWLSVAGAHILGRRELGFTRYDKIAEVLGAWSTCVEDPEDIKPALEKAFTCGGPAVINVITDPNAQAQTRPFGGW